MAGPHGTSAVMPHAVSHVPAAQLIDALHIDDLACDPVCTSSVARGGDDDGFGQVSSPVVREKQNGRHRRAPPGRAPCQPFLHWSISRSTRAAFAGTPRCWCSPSGRSDGRRVRSRSPASVIAVHQTVNR